MMRGLERREVFRDDDDRRDVLNRLSRLRPEWGGTCYAWVFMSNHVHLVLRTGKLPLAWLMRRLNTGFARQFNDRHERIGYLFQDRFKSRLVGDDDDLRNLIRYVHLNPCRGLGLPLGEYPWSGHAALMGLRAPYPFECIRSALALFDDEPEAARRKLSDWMNVDESAPAESSVTRVDLVSDDAGVESAALDAAPPRAVIEARSIDDLVDDACRRFAARRQDLERGARYERVSLARAWVAFIAVAEWRMPAVQIARRVGVSPQALSRAIVRGAQLVDESRRPREETWLIS